MEGRGRKSSASLAVIKGGAGARIEPPKGMPKAQRELWLAVVGSKPADWFGPDNAPLLSEYVRAVDMANKLERQIDRLTESDEVDSEELRNLLNMRDKESRRVTSLATKMRLSQQSKYTEKSAATADRRASSQGGKLWQFGGA